MKKDTDTFYSGEIIMALHPLRWSKVLHFPGSFFFKAARYLNQEKQEWKNVKQSPYSAHNREIIFK